MLKIKKYQNQRQLFKITRKYFQLKDQVRRAMLTIQIKIKVMDLHYKIAVIWQKIIAPITISNSLHSQKVE